MKDIVIVFETMDGRKYISSRVARYLNLPRPVTVDYLAINNEKYIWDNYHISNTGGFRLLNFQEFNAIKDKYTIQYCEADSRKKNPIEIKPLSTTNKEWGNIVLLTNPYNQYFLPLVPLVRSIGIRDSIKGSKYVPSVTFESHTYEEFLNLQYNIYRDTGFVLLTPDDYELIKQKANVILERCTNQFIKTDDFQNPYDDISQHKR